MFTTNAICTAEVNSFCSSHVTYTFKIFFSKTYIFLLPTFRGIKLMKGKALRKHSLHEKTAASVLLKPFISSNE